MFGEQLCYPCSIDDLLRLTVERKASDLHLAVGIAPTIRINGAVKRTELPPLKSGQIRAMMETILSQAQLAELGRELELDFSYAIPGCARYRGNVILQRGTFAAVFRAVPFICPTLSQLGLPEDLRRLCQLPHGLVLVTGPTGSGKSTTTAAMIDYINTNLSQNIVTVEDPIEFLHAHKQSIVCQREIGLDTHSYSRALRQVLRHDPDVIMIGEMRDKESIAIALSAAETGHLVLSTLHTQTAPLTISRIVDVFSDAEKGQVRQQLANSLRGVISQRLIPSVDNGRVVAVEYMTDTPAVKNLIREGKEHQLYNAIQTAQAQDMRTMDQSLLALCRQGKVSIDVARARCTDVSEFDRLIQNNYF